MAKDTVYSWRLTAERSGFGWRRLHGLRYSNRIQQVKAASAVGGLRQLTVRLPGALLARAQAVAKARGKSVSELVRGALENLDREAREAELVQAYELVGSDSASEVGDAFEIQAEVVRRA